MDHVFLRDRLRNAATYDRIAGYFRSSIFEVAAEEIAQIDRVRIVCNSDLDPDDLRTSQALRDQALVARWWDAGPPELTAHRLIRTVDLPIAWAAQTQLLGLG